MLYFVLILIKFCVLSIAIQLYICNSKIYGTIVQRIEWEFPKLLIWVRFPLEPH
jgi:hypothetical protein